jgi:hypothetical protein
MSGGAYGLERERGTCIGVLGRIQELQGAYKSSKVHTRAPRCIQELQGSYKSLRAHKRASGRAWVRGGGSRMREGGALQKS